MFFFSSYKSNIILNVKWVSIKKKKNQNYFSFNPSIFYKISVYWTDFTRAQLISFCHSAGFVKKKKCTLYNRIQHRFFACLQKENNTRLRLPGVHYQRVYDFKVIYLISPVHWLVINITRNNRIGFSSQTLYSFFKKFKDTSCPCLNATTKKILRIISSLYE